MMRVAASRAAALRPRLVVLSAPHSRVLSSASPKSSPANESTRGGASLASAVPADAAADAAAAAPSRVGGGLLARLFSDRDGRNPLLAALGYYSRESIALGAGRSVYSQLRARAESTARSLSAGGEQPFTLRFEMLSVHVYLTLRRLRREKGSALESDCKTVMQCVFDVFWTDVRNRMLIEEEGMTLIPSGRWVKECEQIFFGMATAFDDAWEDKETFRSAMVRNITSVRGKDVDGFFRYLWSEKERLDAMPMETFLEEKEVWSPVFKPLGKNRRPL